VACNTKTRLAAIVIEELRASWQTGSTMNVTTRADDGTQLKPSRGSIVGPTKVVITEEATFVLYASGRGTRFFMTGDGTYARVWPAANFKRATEPVLRACGDHW
jgi:hypothetical protein